jgi:(S)-ureidoglycine aminohydrolase
MQTPCFDKMLAVSDYWQKAEMTPHTYYVPKGGHPPATQLATGRACFTESYAVIPRGQLQDIVTSYFPGWEKTRGWVLARPLSGFAETFSQVVLEVSPGGGSTDPEPDATAEAVVFVVGGEIHLSFDGKTSQLQAGGYAYLPAGLAYTVKNVSPQSATFHWFRKAYEPAKNIAAPQAIITRDQDVTPIAMPGTHGAWATSRFVDPADLAHDMHVNIVTFQPGGSIPFAETHVMEHGIYILQGKAAYLLNTDWVEVEAGDFLWLRAFCPQACIAAGPEPFRYLLYKDVNRHMPLRLSR